MSPRKPPRLATWLLNRFGVAHQNPPLVGDLLEEFRAGRSAAWYWRQTLIVILTGFARNARRFRGLLVARLIGWAAACVFALGLWLYLPPHLDGLVALSSGVALLLPWLWAVMGLKRRRKTSDAERLEEWSQLDEDTRRLGQRILMRVYAGLWFIVCLMAYGLVAFLVARSSPIPLGAFLLFQLELLIGSVNDVFAPSKEPGLVITLLTRERP